MRDRRSTDERASRSCISLKGTGPRTEPWGNLQVICDERKLCGGIPTVDSLSSGIKQWDTVGFFKRMSTNLIGHRLMVDYCNRLAACCSGLPTSKTDRSISLNALFDTSKQVIRCNAASNVIL